MLMYKTFALIVSFNKILSSHDFKNSWSQVDLLPDQTKKINILHSNSIPGILIIAVTIFKHNRPNFSLSSPVGLMCLLLKIKRSGQLCRWQLQAMITDTSTYCQYFARQGEKQLGITNNIFTNICSSLRSRVGYGISFGVDEGPTVVKWTQFTIVYRLYMYVGQIIHSVILLSVCPNLLSGCFEMLKNHPKFVLNYLNTL